MNDISDLPGTDQHLERIKTELRRGVLVLAVLAAMRDEQYGYSLRKKLLTANFDIEEGTLYPLIRRLESQGFLESEWREGESKKRRYYRLSAAGAEVLADLTQSWNSTVSSLSALLENQP